MQPLSKEEQKIYDNSKYCHICKKVFGKHKYHMKVRDQDHYTGKFRGAAHSICNLRYSTPIDIPVFFHNGTNHDFNLLIEEFANEYKSDINCIPLNTNKYMSFSVPPKKELIKPSGDDDDDKKEKKKVLRYRLKFIDSAKHMARGLSTLVDNLSELTICNCTYPSEKEIIIKAKKAHGIKIIYVLCARDVS